MAITASTNTAFDVPALVSQLMSVERRPIDRLNARVASYESKISSFGTLKSLVSGFQSATQSFSASLAKLTATSSDTGALAAAASSGAVPATYSVNVTRLAQSQNLVAAGQSSINATIGDGTATTLTFDFGTINGGTLANGQYTGATFTSNGSGAKSVVIDSSNNTLEGIRDAINAAKLGVTATLVNDGSSTPWRLALTSTQSGEANSIKITTSGGDGTLDNLLAYNPAGTQNLSQTQAAQNANLTVNGIAITSASNTVVGAIDGVTLTLKNLTSTPASLTVARDSAGLGTAATSFVEAYNAMMSQIKARSAYGSNGKEGGALAGDNVLRLMQEQLRNIFTTPASGGTLSLLAEVGITSRADGSLALDTSKLQNAIAADFDDVANLFNSATGFTTRLHAWAKSALDAGGLIDSRTQSLKDYVADRNQEIDRLEAQMAALERKYTAEYTNLNLLLSRMNSTSTFLTQQLLAQPRGE